MTQPTYACVLTPAGRGAVATIAVRGPEALNAVARRFDPLSKRPLASYGSVAVVVGQFRSANQAREELVVGIVAPDRVEVHCHGGRAAVEAVLQALAEEGCRVSDWREHIADDSADPIEADGWLALPSATTERTAGLLLDQIRGALRREIEQVLQMLQQGSTTAAADRLTTLIQRSRVGLHLTEPWRIAIVGKPNVGKSSLINALLGYQRAIVFDQPGTTRDVLTARTALAGWPVELLDTAGLREVADPLEHAGIEQARAATQDADLLLALFEAASDWTADDAALLAGVGTAPTLVVYNKSDLGQPAADGRPAGSAVSARTGANLPQLISAIVERLVPMPIEPGAAVPFTPRQVEAISTANQALSDGQPMLAAQSLRSLLVIPAPDRSIP